jgi:hypothetical protein
VYLTAGVKEEKWFIEYRGIAISTLMQKVLRLVLWELDI